MMMVMMAGHAHTVGLNGCTDKRRKKEEDSCVFAVNQRDEHLLGQQRYNLGRLTAIRECEEGMGITFGY